MTTDTRALEVTRYKTLEDIHTLKREWHSLEDCCPGLTVFSTWEWCATVAEFYGSKRPLWLFAFRDGGRLVGLAPLAEVSFFGLRLLRHIGTGLGRYSMADYEDLLIAGGYEDAVTGALCDEFARMPPTWDILHLQELPQGSRTIGPLVSSARDRGWTAQVRPDSDVYPLPLDGDWDSYKARLSRTTRNDTGRQTRKLMREKGGSFVTADGDQTDIEGAMEALFDLHSGRWASMERPGIFRDPHKRGFHRELARRFSRRGTLMLSLLNAGERTIAAKYGFEHGGTQYHYAGGFDTGPEWSHYRLGMILDLHIIQQAFERDLSCVDFMRGEGRYKRHYRTQCGVNQQIFVFRNLRARLHYQAALALRRVKERAARSLLGREQSDLAGKL